MAVATSRVSRRASADCGVVVIRMPGAGRYRSDQSLSLDVALGAARDKSLRRIIRVIPAPHKPADPTKRMAQISLICPDQNCVRLYSRRKSGTVRPLPIMVPVTRTRRRFLLSRASDRLRGGVNSARRALTRSSSRASTFARNESTTASLYSGPSSRCASAAARRSCADKGGVLTASG